MRLPTFYEQNLIPNWGRDLNAAIGWLARENKIDFECSNGDDCLFLSVNVYIG